MSETVGPVYHDHHTEHPFLGQRLAAEGGVSDATVHAIETEARRLLNVALEQAKTKLRQHKAALERLVAALLEQESIERTGLMLLLGEPSDGAATAHPHAVSSA